MKKLAVVLSVLLLAIIFVSCATSATFTGTRIGCVSNQESYKVSLSCHSFNGTATYKIKTDEDHARNIHYDITVEEGTLIVEIQDNDGNQLYKDTFTPDSQPEQNHCYGVGYGKYKIMLTADEFRGSYVFDWSTEYDY